MSRRLAMIRKKVIPAGFRKFFGLIARQSVHDDIERRPG
jgi:hypothetical protein